MKTIQAEASLYDGLPPVIRYFPHVRFHIPCEPLPLVMVVEIDPRRIEAKDLTPKYLDGLFGENWRIALRNGVNPSLRKDFMVSAALAISEVPQMYDAVPDEVRR